MTKKVYDVPVTVRVFAESAELATTLVQQAANRRCDDKTIIVLFIRAGEAKEAQ